MPSTALSGIRVLDLSRILAAPLATQMLADLGAEVIKVERPGAGDDSRTYGPPFAPGPEGDRTDTAAFYLSCNRNKQSVTVNHATAEGQELIRALAARSDVLVENFRAGDAREVRTRSGESAGAQSAAGLPLRDGLRADRSVRLAPRL